MTDICRYPTSVYPWPTLGVDPHSHGPSSERDHTPAVGTSERGQNSAPVAVPGQEVTPSAALPATAPEIAHASSSTSDAHDNVDPVRSIPRDKHDIVYTGPASSLQPSTLMGANENVISAGPTNVSSAHDDDDLAIPYELLIKAVIRSNQIFSKQDVQESFSSAGERKVMTDEETMAAIQPLLKYCPFTLKGAPSCVYGDNCKLIKVCKHWHTERSCFSGDECPSSHEVVVTCSKALAGHCKDRDCPRNHDQQIRTSMEGMRILHKNGGYGVQSS